MQSRWRAAYTDSVIKEANAFPRFNKLVGEFTDLGREFDAAYDSYWSRASGHADKMPKIAS